MNWNTPIALALAGGLCLAAAGAAHAQTAPATVPPSASAPEPPRNPELGDPGARTSAKPPTPQERAGDAIVAPNGPAPDRAEAGGGAR